MRTIFGRHRIRANFYHFVSMLYVLTMIMWGIGILSDMTSTWIGFSLFTIDYLAQMYDPHPANPGPWFRAHFHRFVDDEDVVDVESDSVPNNLFLVCIVSLTIVLIAFVLSEMLQLVTVAI